MNLYAGIDIGGTNIKCGIIDIFGNILQKSTVAIGEDKSAKAVAGLSALQLKSMVENIGDSICSIGVGIPGLIDSEKGVVVYSGNLGWKNENFEQLLKTHFDLPIKIANDANVAVLGEVKFGIGKNYKNCVMLTLGTGVGGGIIIDGKIYSGKGGVGAELGHMIIEAFGRKCTCGGRGCLEAYASATALKEQTKKAMLENPDSKMWKIGVVERVSGKTAFEFYDVDESARQTVDNYLEYLSVGIVNIANIFRPDAIILGGGVSYEGERLLQPLRSKLDEKIFAGNGIARVELLLASLKNDAGFMGAAMLNIGQ